MIYVLSFAFDVDQNARFVINDATPQFARSGERVDKGAKPYPLDNTAHQNLRSRQHNIKRLSQRS